MRIGFTGTQHGMNRKQLEELRRFLQRTEAYELHHGDCIGADAQAHAIALALGVSIVIHPPINPAKRAFCKGTEVLPENEYLIRNHHIVDQTDILVAAPKTDYYQLRSGTWATVRYAKLLDKPVVVLLPSGGIRKITALSGLKS